MLFLDLNGTVRNCASSSGFPGRASVPEASDFRVWHVPGPGLVLSSYGRYISNAI